MEHKHEFLASRSVEVVRLADLAIFRRRFYIIYILSHLPIKGLARFCCVSKPCRDMSTCELRLKLVNALDRLLRSRGDHKMWAFDLVWEGHSEDHLDPECSEV